MAGLTNEILVLCALYAIVAGTHYCANWWERKQKEKEDNCLEPLDPFANIKRNTQRVAIITIIAAGLAHPTVLHTIQHYIVHFVIYSGYIIKSH